VRLQRQDCRTCHGPDLTGSPDAGVGNLTDVSCDSCHQDGWREDCTYCHGGDSNETGAPPRGLGGTGADFPHDAHVASPVHASRPCSECHVEPTDVLSEGHAFDDTPGRAEVDLTGGVARDAVWDGSGRSDGEVLLTDAPLGCNGCHVGPGSALDDFVAMSGRHRAHERHGVPCADCHPTVGTDNQILDRAAHVNQVVDFAMPPEVTIDQGHCTGTCHGEPHNGISW
jgi:hypothetical protein